MFWYLLFIFSYGLILWPFDCACCKLAVGDSLLPIDNSVSCCNSFSARDYESLNNCISRQNLNCKYDFRLKLNTTSDVEISAKDVILVTFASEDVLSYGAYSNSINSAYAEANGYPFVIVTEEDHVEYRSSNDQRWSKIHILKHALSQQDSDNPDKKDINNESIHQDCPYGWASSAKYLVWLDTDLVILDFKLKIEDIVEKYPDADIIMSKDKATFVANSGMIIVRNSPSSIDLLSRWWASFDRKKCCDQNAFTWLYDRMDADERRRVALLPHDAINTNFPCWKNQKKHNQVLHLAGLTSFYRISVFKFGWESICKSLSIDNKSDEIVISNSNVIKRSRIISNQLGLSRKKLYSMIISVNSKRISFLKSIKVHLEDVLTDRNTIAIPDRGHLTHIASKVADAIKTDPDEPTLDEKVAKEVYSLVAGVKRLIFECHLARYTTISNYLRTNSLPYRDEVPPIAVLSNRNESISLIEEGLSVIAAGFDWSSYVIRDNAETRVILRKFKSVLFGDLPLLIRRLSPERRTTVLVPQSHYYQFKFKHFMASTYNAKSIIDSLIAGIDNPKYEQRLIRCLSLLEQSIQYWNVMSTYNYYGTSYVMADPYKEGYEVMTEIGVILCFRKQHKRGLAYLERARDLQEETLRGYGSILIMPDDLASECRAQLAVTSTNLEICKREMLQSLGLSNHAVLSSVGKQKKYYRKKK